MIIAGEKELFSVIRRDDGILGINCEIYNHEGKLIASVHRGKVLASDSDYTETNEPGLYRLIERKTNRVLAEIKRGNPQSNVLPKSLIYPDGPPKSFRAVQIIESQLRERPVELEVTVDLYTSKGFRLMAGPDFTNDANSNVYTGNMDIPIRLP
jgi:hypothetical protein